MISSVVGDLPSSELMETVIVLTCIVLKFLHSKFVSEQPQESDKFIEVSCSTTDLIHNVMKSLKVIAIIASIHLSSKIVHTKDPEKARSESDIETMNIKVARPIVAGLYVYIEHLQSLDNSNSLDFGKYCIELILPVLKFEAGYLLNYRLRSMDVPGPINNFFTGLWMGSFFFLQKRGDIAATAILAPSSGLARFGYDVIMKERIHEENKEKAINLALCITMYAIGVLIGRYSSYIGLALALALWGFIELASEKAKINVFYLFVKRMNKYFQRMYLSELDTPNLVILDTRDPRQGMICMYISFAKFFLHLKPLNLNLEKFKAPSSRSEITVRLDVIKHIKSLLKKFESKEELQKLVNDRLTDLFKQVQLLKASDKTVQNQVLPCFQKIALELKQFSFFREELEMLRRKVENSKQELNLINMVEISKQIDGLNSIKDLVKKLNAPEYYSEELGKAIGKKVNDLEAQKSALKQGDPKPVVDLDDKTEQINEHLKTGNDVLLSINDELTLPELSEKVGKLCTIRSKLNKLESCFSNEQIDPVKNLIRNIEEKVNLVKTKKKEMQEMPKEQNPHPHPKTKKPCF